MKAYDEAMYWMRNDDWFTVNHEKDCFELTDAAPPRAVESFKLYLRGPKSVIAPTPRKMSEGRIDHSSSWKK